MAHKDGWYFSKEGRFVYYPTSREAKRAAQSYANQERQYVEVWSSRTHRSFGVQPKTQSNPSSIRAQVRRLPSGQIQLKIPIGKSENPSTVIEQLKRVFGKRVKAVEMTSGKRKRNPDETYYKAGDTRPHVRRYRLTMSNDQASEETSHRTKGGVRAQIRTWNAKGMYATVVDTHTGKEIYDGKALGF